jgi:hypothetical protein
MSTTPNAQALLRAGKLRAVLIELTTADSHLRVAEALAGWDSSIQNRIRDVRDVIDEICDTAAARIFGLENP